jgi:hypothetical protein
MFGVRSDTQKPCFGHHEIKTSVQSLTLGGAEVIFAERAEVCTELK